MHINVLLLRIIKFFVFTLLITSCSTSKPINLQNWSSGLTTEWIHIQEHNILLLEKPALNDNQREIHIYIEGDGTPWIKRYLMAENPTPRYPLALELMKRDPNLSFYVGRPCYYQSNDFYLALRQPDNASPCDFHYWTDARYSATVVTIMKAAIQEKLIHLSPTQQNLPVILIGHSGGGTLAMLLTQRMNEINGVITIAANMDIKAWTEKQGYSPLKNSLNIADEIAWRKVPQVHYAGSIDNVVPPQINMPLMQKMGQSLTIINGFNHSCCWLKEWPTLLNNADEKLKQQGLTH